MTPLQRYQTDIDKQRILADPNQATIINQLQQLYTTLLSSLRWRWFKPMPKGIYLWGPVGAGKTYLMDLFFDALPTQHKLRIHFHLFMQHVHAELTRLQGHADPLTVIARNFAAQTRILCLDEFMVEDIGDAMVLSGLLTALFKRGLCLITTSNIPPDKLYWNGLQRQRFLPAIKLLEKHTDVVCIQSQRDYRQHRLKKNGVYFTPLDDHAQQAMHHCFELYAHHGGKRQATLTINQRDIPTIHLAHNVVWFDFNVICHTPRSQTDYLVIAERYPVVLISNVPQIQACEYDKVTYLINLVDIFYDARIELILSAAVPIKQLYPNGPKQATFQRTMSRLQEMQSLDYLQAL